MSQLHEDLLAPRITKKRIIAVVLVTGFLISFFTFSVYLTSFLFGTQRIDPSEKVEDADYDEYLLVIPPPDDYKDLLDDIDLDDLDIDDLDDLKDLGIDVDDIDQDDLDELAQLVDEEDIADFLEEMNDGDIDNYDLTEAGLLIAALLFSDVEVFRVFDYDNPVEDREDILWRYECFDQFNGDGWESTIPKLESSFPTLEDYYLTYSYLDKIKLKRPMSTNIGTNSFVMGTLFPEPYVIEETISADNLNPEPALSRLYKDDMECVVADLSFNSAENVSLYYELFGWGINPNTNEEINNTAVNAIYTPSLIKNQFLQLPPNIGTYKTSNPFFNSHWNVLNSAINATDNAFMVANKIRNYLQANFELSIDELIDDPPGEGEDVVEWFCEKEEGLYSEFASAFCAFTRAFGVSSRFVDGYNSRLIEEMFDNDELLNTYAIKYKNIYDWAEIYVPWDTSGLLGHGQWIQMDILYESFGLGGSPITVQDYNLTVTSNATQPSSTFNRGDTAEITANLNSTANPVDGRTITFTDESTGILLDSNTTDINGVASIEVNIGSNHVVGPNIIKATDQGGTENYTLYIVDDEIEVVLNQPNPQEVNISAPIHTTRVSGYVNDPSSPHRVANAQVNFLLLYKGTNNPLPFNPFNIISTTTDSNGDFDELLEVQNYVPYGQYDLRVDFNGTWSVFGFPYPPYASINDSSAIFDFNVTREITYDLLFSINNRPTEYPFDPNPSTIINKQRGELLNLSVTVIDSIDRTPVADINVDFYDFTNGDILIGSDITNSYGNASLLYSIDNSRKSGPNLVYAKVGGVENYSYFIINEPISIIIDSYTIPLDIDLANPSQFNIQCRLVDEFNNPIYDSPIDLRMNRSGLDYTAFLDPSPFSPIDPNSVGSNIYSINRGVLSGTPINNYSLRLEFNGVFNYDYPNYPYRFQFYLGYLSNISYLQNQLNVSDSNNIELKLSVEGESTRDLYDVANPPQNYTRGQLANFQVWVFQSLSPVSSGYVTIWDDYTNYLLDNKTLVGTNFIQFAINTNNFSYAGIHRIRVQYRNYPTVNYTFIVINETVNVNIDQTIITPDTNNVILRNNGGFTVSGYVKENGTGLRGLRVKVLLFNSSYEDVSHYLVGGTQTVTTGNNGFYQFLINQIDLPCPHGQYYIRVDFNGSIVITDAPGIDLISDFIVSNSSMLIPLNVTAGTSIDITSYSTERDILFPNYWVNKTTLHVEGGLDWDNSTALGGVFINVTVQWLNGTVISFNSTELTDPLGQYSVNLLITDNWPDLRSETKIVVYFNPKNSNLQHVEGDSYTVFP